MKNEIRMALLCLAGTAIPAFAQNASPLCGATNYDHSQKIYTINKPAADTVNQQCYVVVYPKGSMPVEAAQNPASYIVEGSYAILLSGGGGGGGSGARSDQGGGGGGAGAAPMRSVQYLAPGVYKLTLGTGGEGGKVGGRAKEGNPSSLTLASNGQLVAGTQGADMWQQRYGDISGGLGGVALAGGSKGGSGGDSGPSSEKSAEVGGQLQTTGYSGTPGLAGGERKWTPEGSASVQANAGGGGGAGVGSGGAGESPLGSPAAGTGKLGAGGGGGSGGRDAAYAGGKGGHGFIQLSLHDMVRPAAVITGQK